MPCWFAAVVGVCKLCHASADGRQESAWRALWKKTAWPDGSAGDFHISAKPGDGLCTARQAPLPHLSGDAAEKWKESWPVRTVTPLVTFLPKAELLQQALGLRPWLGTITGVDLLLGIKWTSAIPLH